MSDSGKPEFDQFSENYARLLADPSRQRFAPSDNLYFHERKREVLQDYFRRRRTDTHALAYLDVGCGKGELLSLIRSDFGRVAAANFRLGCCGQAIFPQKESKLGSKTTRCRYPSTNRSSI